MRQSPSTSSRASPVGSPGRPIPSIGAITTEVKGSHVVILTQPKAVADVIEQAAKGAQGAKAAAGN